jgi:hypothetical protein
VAAACGTAGLNDGGAAYTHGAASGQLFLDFLDEPPGSTRRRQRGIYAVHTVGQLQLVLLDVRSSRDPYRPRVISKYANRNSELAEICLRL